MSQSPVFVALVGVVGAFAVLYIALVAAWALHMWAAASADAAVMFGLFVALGGAALLVWAFHKAEDF